MNPSDPTFLQELWTMIRQERKWFLVPLLIALATLGLIAVLTATPAAPFIYTLF